MKAGTFITFEGGEGAGKSTQAKLLARRLSQQHGLEVVVTREPGGSPLAEKIRDVVLSARPEASETEFLLFAAARVEHIAVTIAPALAAGRWVICDRYVDSTRVYQGRLGGVAVEFIDAVQKFSVVPHLPDLTVILDVPATLSMERARERGALSRFDAAECDQHQILRDGFLEIAASEPERCVVIDGSKDIDEVGSDVYSVVAERLLSRSD